MEAAFTAIESTNGNQPATLFPSVKALRFNDLWFHVKYVAVLL